MRYLVLAALFALSATSVQAVTIDEITSGEFSDVYSAPTDFTGASTINGVSNGTMDIEYFRIDAFSPSASQLDFTLFNNGAGSNAEIRVSSTPFAMAEWDWTINQIGGAQLYANQWAPTDTYSFSLPTGFTGPLYGFFRFYDTNSASQFTLSVDGAASVGGTVTPVPLPASIIGMLAGLIGLGGFGVARRRSA